MKVKLFAGFVFLISMNLQASMESPTQERGFDRESFTATFYDRTDLLDFLLSRPYTVPIDFRLECFGESPPLPSCKLIDELADGGDWSVSWEGKLIVPIDGEYTFRLSDVDDGARLFLKGDEIMDQGWYWPDDDRHPSPQTVSLSAGENEFRIDYEQRYPGRASLEVRWAGPDFADEVIPMAGYPPFSTSLYMTNDILTEDMEGLDHEKIWEQGCFAALKGGNANLVVILDFGEPNIKEGKYGAYLNYAPEGEFLSTSKIKDAAIDFIEGYWECSSDFHAAYLTLAIGTKNTRILADASPQAEEHGQAWAELVNEVDNWIEMTDRSKRLAVAGAIDIETWGGEEKDFIISKVVPAGARCWAKAYVDSTDKPYYNYGTCEGCLGAGGKVEENEWNLDDWWYLSWGIKDKTGKAGRAYPIPEIYGIGGTDTHARQWRDLMKYALNKCGTDEECRRFIFFPGTLTQCGVVDPFEEEFDCRNANTNKPAKGWQQLYDALLEDPETSHAASFLLWSTDIINLHHYEPMVSSVEEASSDTVTPRSLNLSLNYTNPFNPTIWISYSIPKTDYVILKVYNLLGNEIETLINEMQLAGEYEIHWAPVGLPSGVYVFRLQVGTNHESKRLLLLK